MKSPPPNRATRVIVVLIVIIVLVGGIGGLIASAKKAKEHDAWLAFKATHRCEAVDHRDGERVSVASHEAKGPDTVGSYVTPAQTGWRCDDGVVRFVDDE